MTHVFCRFEDVFFFFKTLQYRALRSYLTLLVLYPLNTHDLHAVFFYSWQLLAIFTKIHQQYTILSLQEKCAIVWLGRNGGLGILPILDTNSSKNIGSHLFQYQRKIEHGQWLNRLAEANSVQIHVAIGHHKHSIHFIPPWLWWEHNRGISA